MKTTNFKISVMLTLLLAIGMNAYAQNGDNVVWKKNFGGRGIDLYNSVTSVSDGIIAAGCSEEDSFGGNGDWAGLTGRGDLDAILVKYDNSGKVVWKKNFGGSSDDEYNSVTATSDGIIAAGHSDISSFGAGDWAGVAGKGYDDAILVKYDNSGKVVWKSNFGGEDFDDYSCVTAVSDGIIAAGSSYHDSFGTGDWAGVAGKGREDAIIVKYDKNGKVVWNKNFGGKDEDYYYSVTPVSDGIVAAGYSYPSSFNNGDWAGVAGKGGVDAIIVKYDNSGKVVWKKNFGGSNGDSFQSVTTVSDGIIAVGHSYAKSFGNGDWTGVAGKGNTDAIIVKYNNSGNVVWKKNFGGSGDDLYTSVKAVADGIIAVGASLPGSFGNGDWAGVKGRGKIDAIIVKYDNSGNVVWKNRLGGSDFDTYFAVTSVSDGIIAVGGSDYESFGNGDWTGVAGKGDDDAIIVKYVMGTTGIVETRHATSLQVYPNPTNGELRIENGELTTGNVEIYDMYGKKMVNGKWSMDHSIDVSHLPAGMYFLKIGDKTAKFVKQ